MDSARAGTVQQVTWQAYVTSGRRKERTA